MSRPNVKLTYAPLDSIERAALQAFTEFLRENGWPERFMWEELSRRAFTVGFFEGRGLGSRSEPLADIALSIARVDWPRRTSERRI